MKGKGRTGVLSRLTEEYCNVRQKLCYLGKELDKNPSYFPSWVSEGLNYEGSCWSAGCVYCDDDWDRDHKSDVQLPGIISENILHKHQDNSNNKNQMGNSSSISTEKKVNDDNQQKQKRKTKNNNASKKDSKGKIYKGTVKGPNDVVVTFFYSKGTVKGPNDVPVTDTSRNQNQEKQTEELVKRSPLLKNKELNDGKIEGVPGASNKISKEPQRIPRKPDSRQNKKKKRGTLHRELNALTAESSYWEKGHNAKMRGRRWKMLS